MKFPLKLNKNINFLFESFEKNSKQTLVHANDDGSSIRRNSSHEHMRPKQWSLQTTRKCAVIRLPDAEHPQSNTSYVKIYLTFPYVSIKSTYRLMIIHGNPTPFYENN